jgi:ABC-2 type transport system ATP-binding protein
MKVLAALGLGERAHDAVRIMSGGMKQRVSLACAMARPAELLLLDEPTAGIDPVLRARFWEEFRSLSDAGACLLVSTHQIDEAVHCDRLLVVRGGGLLADTTPEALLRSGSTRVRLTGAHGGEQVRRFPSGDPGLIPWLRSLDEASLARLDVRNETLEDILVRLIREAEDGA